ncbi:MULTISPECIES: hypothetical protein [Bacillaceae]|jgi:hypothetical protein|uniref:hypothetical protein n=1 Tax=Heyndrickxia oleronia TaxID=38875 RepID=UPI0015D4376F|nr:hypothetical protein [Heyndrickxia oleronia]NYV66962.1 hypothetical protein [Bacillus sp. Gen3]
MGKWNEEAAPNNNLNTVEMKSRKRTNPEQNHIHEFSEELSDGGERNQAIEQFQKKNK